MFLVNPEWVAPFSVSAFTVVNKETDQGKTQGVGGGIVYALELDTKHQLDVAIVRGRSDSWSGRWLI